MKKENKFLIALLLLLLITGFCFVNLKSVYAKEPIMEYKYTVEESKIKRAQFIWISSLEEMQRNNVLTKKEVKNIKVYIKDLKQIGEDKSKLEGYSIEKNVLKISTVDKLIEDRIISKEQGEVLKAKLNSYDISNLND